MRDWHHVRWIGDTLIWLRRSLPIALLWFCRPFNDSFRIIQLVAILTAIVAFVIDLGYRQEAREARAWQLLTTKAPGNSGKIWALEYLNTRRFRPFSSLAQGRVPLDGVDLTPPDLVRTQDKLKDGELFPDNRCRRGTYLRGVKLPHAQLMYAVFMCADLRRADFQRANLAEANFRGAILQATDFREAILLDADLRETLLQVADLRGALLKRTNLTRALLSGAQLQGADLEQADLREVTAIGCGQLKQANNWQKAYRDEELACGAVIPSPPNQD